MHVGLRPFRKSRAPRSRTHELSRLDFEIALRRNEDRCYLLSKSDSRKPDLKFSLQSKDSWSSRIILHFFEIACRVERGQQSRSARRRLRRSKAVLRGKNPSLKLPLVCRTHKCH
jgi:hypothetical protein